MGYIAQYQQIRDRIEVAKGWFKPDDDCVAITGSREDIILMLEAVKEDRRKYGIISSGTLISMPCGAEYRLKEISDIPFADLPCSCGRANHYFVRIKECE